MPEGRRSSRLDADEQLVLDLTDEPVDRLAASDPSHAAAVRRSGEQGVIEHTFLPTMPSLARAPIPANAPTLAPFVCGASRRPLRS